MRRGQFLEDFDLAAANNDEVRERSARVDADSDHDEKGRVSDPLPRASRAALLLWRGRLRCPPLERDIREAAGGRSHTMLIRLEIDSGDIFDVFLRDQFQVLNRSLRIALPGKCL